MTSVCYWTGFISLPPVHIRNDEAKTSLNSHISNQTPFCDIFIIFINDYAFLLFVHVLYSVLVVLDVCCQLRCCRRQTVEMAAITAGTAGNKLSQNKKDGPSARFHFKDALIRLFLPAFGSLRVLFSYVYFYVN